MENNISTVTDSNTNEGETTIIETEHLRIEIADSTLALLREVFGPQVEAL